MLGQVAVMFVCVSLAAASGGCDKSRIDLSGLVYLYPSASIVELSAQSTAMTVSVRNTSLKPLKNLRMSGKSDACSVRVEPATVPAIAPGDRRSFTLTLTRSPDAQQKRYPLELTLHTPDLPAPAGLDLILDLGVPTADTWIDVGQVTLIQQDNTRTVYYLLAGVPVLFLVGWLLWRWSRPKGIRN